MTITTEQLAAYRAHLRAEERCAATVAKYLHDAGAFALWLDDRPLTKEAVADWKAELLRRGQAPATVNAALVETARAKGRTRLALLLETIGGTGVRVSEVAYITVEAAQRGRAEIALKGKIRTILLPAKLCRKLLKYAKANGFTAGSIFRTSSGKALSRHQIWGEMKALCKAAGVEPSKVFPHNLRHLFAVAFYKASRDIVKLADVLGHSSIETTRIYLMTTEKEHQRQLDRLRLVS